MLGVDFSSALDGEAPQKVVSGASFIEARVCHRICPMASSNMHRFSERHVAFTDAAWKSAKQGTGKLDVGHRW